MGYLSVPKRNSLTAFLLSALIALVLVAAFAWLSPVFAQEGGEAAPKDTPKFSLVGHIFTTLIRHALLFAIIFLLISIGLVFLIVLLFMDLRMAVATPPAFVEEFTDVLNRRRFKEAYELAKNENSFLGRVLTTGMSRLQYGIDDAREAAASMVETIKASKDTLISYLAVVGTLGPLLGLVGTVIGMIKAFGELGAAAGGKSPEFSKLAEALSEALVVTLIGIALSLPAVFFHNFFKNRLTSLAMDTANIGDDLLTQMYHNSKKPAPAEAPAAPAKAGASKGG